jgi:hypothetical protein
MFRLAHALTILLCALAAAASAAVAAAPLETAESAAGGKGVTVQRKKKPGDVTYRTMWRMQKRVEAMLPKTATMISPVLRLSTAGMGEFERTEFKPESWAVAIVGKTVDELVPMRRGGYFALPSLPQAQARSEDAIVMFNLKARKNWFDVGWHVNVPTSGTFSYMQFGQALAELKMAQSAIPWWDIMAIPEKNARFDAIRACFTSDQGKILVAGAQSGQKLTTHCTLLAFDSTMLRANPAIAFAGGLDFVTLDNTANYSRNTEQRL